MRKEKQLLLDEVKEQIERYDSFVIMSYKSLTANKAAEFRKGIAGFGGDVEVMRKRILKKAAEMSGISLDDLNLEGHIGLVYGGTDPLETTKYLFKFSQENNKAIEVVGGRFDGQLYNSADVSMLSELPSKNEMRAQLLGLFEAPMAQTLSAMDALLTSVIHCLKNKSEKAPAEGAAEGSSEGSEE